MNAARFQRVFAARLNFRNLGKFGRFGKLPAEEVEVYHIDDATLDVRTATARDCKTANSIVLGYFWFT